MNANELAGIQLTVDGCYTATHFQFSIDTFNQQPYIPPIRKHNLDVPHIHYSGLESSLNGIDSLNPPFDRDILTGQVSSLG
jgi:hypothetical protein